MDRLLKLVDADPLRRAERLERLLAVVTIVAPKVSGRVILSCREHLMNRINADADKTRLFVNSKGKPWVQAEDRKPLNEMHVVQLYAVLDAEIMRRLPALTNLKVDDSVLSLALPLSEKNKSSGFGIMPRGSTMPISFTANDSVLRFFVYWKQHTERTDYDLSVLLLNKDFVLQDQCSYTRLRDIQSGMGYMTHSGDITSAPTGASEFIDIHLGKVNRDVEYIVPVVNIFSGEDFLTAEEAFFGYMERTANQKGLPYEARTVRMKSDLRGKGRIALPIAFMRDKNNCWTTKWLHVYMNGQITCNSVETNHVSSSLIMKSVVQHQYLTMAYLVDMLKQKAVEDAEKPATYIGLAQPDTKTLNVHKTYTLNNLIELIPA